MKTANKKSMGPVDMSVLNVPQGGVSKTVRESMAVSTDRPVPGGGRPRPKPREKTVVSLPRVKALYDYEAQDLDEISMTEGEVLELVKEGKSNCHKQPHYVYLKRSSKTFIFQTTLAGGLGNPRARRDTSPGPTWRRYDFTSAVTILIKPKIFCDLIYN